MIFGNVDRLDWSSLLPERFIEYIKQTQKLQLKMKMDAMKLMAIKYFAW